MLLWEDLPWIFCWTPVVPVVLPFCHPANGSSVRVAYQKQIQNETNTFEIRDLKCWKLGQTVDASVGEINWLCVTTNTVKWSGGRDNVSRTHVHPGWWTCFLIRYNWVHSSPNHLIGRIGFLLLCQVDLVKYLFKKFGLGLGSFFDRVENFGCR